MITPNDLFLLSVLVWNLVAHLFLDEINFPDIVEYGIESRISFLCQRTCWMQCLLFVVIENRLGLFCDGIDLPDIVEYGIQSVVLFLRQRTSGTQFLLFVIIGKWLSLFCDGWNQFAWYWHNMEPNSSFHFCFNLLDTMVSMVHPAMRIQFIGACNPLSHRFGFISLSILMGD